MASPAATYRHWSAAAGAMLGWDSPAARILGDGLPRCHTSPLVRRWRGDVGLGSVCGQEHQIGGS
jgi:hypothetical protein